MADPIFPDQDYAASDRELKILFVGKSKDLRKVLEAAIRAEALLKTIDNRSNS